jgi:hypothetical protein
MVNLVPWLSRDSREKTSPFRVSGAGSTPSAADPMAERRTVATLKRGAQDGTNLDEATAAVLINGII